jgi:hypothetical protein
MGTKVTTMDYYVPVETANVDQDRAELTIEETIGTRFPTGLEYGTRFFTIPLVGAPRLASLPRILSAFMGQPDTTGSGTPYTHVHDPTLATKIAEWHSLFVVRRDPNPPIVDLFWDARGNTIALDVAPNDFLKMDASFIALDLDDTQTAPTPVTDLTERLKFSTCIVDVSEDGGTTWNPVASAGWGITYNNNLDTDNAVLGSRKLYALPEGNADCEVWWSPREDLNDKYRRALLADPDDLALRMTATGLTGSIEVLVHSTEIVNGPAPVSGADVLKMIEFTARARTAPSTGKFVTITIENDVAAYT